MDDYLKNGGLLLLRAWIAVVFLNSAVPNLVSGEAMHGFAQYLESIEVPFPLLSAYLARLAELGAALLIGSGFFFRIGAAMLLPVMTMATFVASGGAIFGEGQVPFLYLLLALFFLTSGPGNWTLGSLINRQET